MSAKITNLFNDTFSYDQLPYESYPYMQTHPAHLRTLAKLFGHNTAVELDKARVLELGCAAGNNIIPIALNYPNAKVVGIDLSEVQISQANKQVKELGLTNIQFHHKSIMDINKSFGEFDYIIVHGVISWVPVEVQDKILDICKVNLSKKGVAYVSYNTLPGWNMVSSVRDMMIYHIQGFTTENEKIQQSRLLLDFLTEAIENSNTPHAQMLKNEATMLAKQPDHYLYHDHISEINTQFYFHELISKAQKRNLQYLSDANLPSMFLGNMPKNVIEKLQVINDIVRTEQYMDFVNNRRFRCTLLCHDHIQLNRNLQNDIVNDFYISMNIASEEPLSATDFDNDKTVKFCINNDTNTFVSSKSTIMKMLFHVLGENKHYPFKPIELAELAQSKLGNKFTIEQVHNELINNCMQLILAGLMNLAAERTLYSRELTNKPAASKLVQYQATNFPGFWVTNQRHEMINVNIFEKYILRYLDGNHTHEELLVKLTEHVENNDLVFSQEGKKINDKEQIRQALVQAIEATLTKLAPFAVLVA